MWKLKVTAVSCINLHLGLTPVEFLLHGDVFQEGCECSSSYSV